MAGSSIIKALADRSKARKLIVSGCGLREGLFSQYLHEHTDRPLIVPDILATARENMIHLYSPDEEHCRLVARYALQLFQAAVPPQTGAARWEPLLETAALLHDTGITINYYNHTRHSGYLIETGSCSG